MIVIARMLTKDVECKSGLGQNDSKTIGAEMIFQAHACSWVGRDLLAGYDH